MDIDTKKNKKLPINALYLLLLFLLPMTSAHTYCNGKSFQCWNSTHFMICFNIGNGVSIAIPNIIIPCPGGTECHDANKYECEQVKSTTSTISDVTNMQRLVSAEIIAQNDKVTTEVNTNNQEEDFLKRIKTNVMEDIATTTENVKLLSDTTTMIYHKPSTTNNQIEDSLNPIETTISIPEVTISKYTNNDDIFFTTESTVTDSTTETSLGVNALTIKFVENVRLTTADPDYYELTTKNENYSTQESTIPSETISETETSLINNKYFKQTTMVEDETTVSNIANGVGNVPSTTSLETETSSMIQNLFLDNPVNDEVTTIIPPYPPIDEHLEVTTQSAINIDDLIFTETSNVNKAEDVNTIIASSHNYHTDNIHTLSTETTLFDKLPVSMDITSTYPEKLLEYSTEPQFSTTSTKLELETASFDNTIPREGYRIDTNRDSIDKLDTEITLFDKITTVSTDTTTAFYSDKFTELTTDSQISTTSTGDLETTSVDSSKSTEANIFHTKTNNNDQLDTETTLFDKLTTVSIESTATYLGEFTEFNTESEFSTTSTSNLESTSVDRIHTEANLFSIISDNIDEVITATTLFDKFTTVSVDTTIYPDKLTELTTESQPSTTSTDDFETINADSTISTRADLFDTNTDYIDKLSTKTTLFSKFATASIDTNAYSDNFKEFTTESLFTTKSTGNFEVTSIDTIPTEARLFDISSNNIGKFTEFTTAFQFSTTSADDFETIKVDSTISTGAGLLDTNTDCIDKLSTETTLFDKLTTADTDINAYSGKINGLTTESQLSTKSTGDLEATRVDTTIPTSTDNIDKLNTETIILDKFTTESQFSTTFTDDLELTSVDNTISTGADLFYTNTDYIDKSRTETTLFDKFTTASTDTTITNADTYTGLTTESKFSTKSTGDLEAISFDSSVSTDINPVSIDTAVTYLDQFTQFPTESQFSTTPTDDLKTTSFDSTITTEARIFDTSTANSDVDTTSIKTDIKTTPYFDIVSTFNMESTKVDQDLTTAQDIMAYKPFSCVSEGRFSDYFHNNIYYVCVKGKDNNLYKFAFQCQIGFILDKNTVKCFKELSKEYSTTSYYSTSDKKESAADENKYSFSQRHPTIIETTPTTVTTPSFNTQISSISSKIPREIYTATNNLLGTSPSTKVTIESYTQQIPTFKNTKSTIYLGNTRPEITLSLDNTVTTNYKFVCIEEGRFLDNIINDIYYICVKGRDNKIYRFKFQCQNGYLLDKIGVKCVKDITKETSSNVTTRIPVTNYHTAVSATTKKYNLDSTINSIHLTTMPVTDKISPEIKIDINTFTTKLSTVYLGSDTTKTFNLDTTQNAEKSNEFKCLREGRFYDYYTNNIYYICVKGKDNKLYRFKFQCQIGYYLDKNNVKCVKNEITTTTDVATSFIDIPSTTINETSTTEQYNNINNKPTGMPNKIAYNIEITADSKPEFDCTNKDRGFYSDTNNCSKFYSCINGETTGHYCPNNTVFSEVKKQCTRNLSYCVRNNTFQCLKEGRFYEYRKDNVYYICVKANSGKLYKFQFQCSLGYFLDKENVKCVIKTDNKIAEVDKVSKSIESSMSEISEDKKSNEKQWECKEEGYFPNPQDCKSHYSCVKDLNVFKRLTLSCKQGEIFNSELKKCMASLSYECDD